MGQHLMTARAGLALGAILLLAMVFGTTATADTAPTPTIEAPTQVEYTSAHLKGTINPNGGPSITCWRFEIVRKAQLESGEEGWNPVNNECLSEEDSTKSEALPATFDSKDLQPGTVYLARLVASNEGGESTSAEEEFETKAVTPPTVTINQVSSPTAGTFHLSGSVNPNAPEAAPTSAAVESGYRTSWHFECTPGCGSPSGEVEADDSAHEVQADVAPLAPNTHYTVKLIAQNKGGTAEGNETEAGEVAEFTTPLAPPQVGYLLSAAVRRATDTTATLQATVNTRNSELTSCRFEWGPSASYGFNAPCTETIEVVTGIGTSTNYVSTEVSGLSPETTYHFRIVAGNALEEIAGDDRTFMTYPSPTAPGPCPNDQVRIEQLSTKLPECRAWEMVSPPDKNGGQVSADGFLTTASSDGNALAYGSRAGFADTIGSGGAGQTRYIANRGANGWSSHAFTPTPAPNVLQVFVGSTQYGWVSEDLKHAVLWAYQLPGISEQQQALLQIYRQNTETRELELVTKTGFEPYRLNDVFQADWGASDDASHIPLVFQRRLLADAAPGVPNVYEWIDGDLTLAGILPDGSVPEGGSTIRPLRYRNVISRDGSALTFLSPAAGDRQLYQRRDGATVWVSESENEGIESSGEVVLEWASQDGRYLIFGSNSQLLPDDTDEGPDLYRYTAGPDPANEDNLKLITRDVQDIDLTFGGGAVVGASEDGSRVYFDDVNGNQYLWEEGVTTHITAEIPRVYEGRDGTLLAASDSSPGASRVSRDGSILAFLAEGPSHEGPAVIPTGDPVGPPKPEEEPVSRRLTEMFVYDAQRRTLTCVSCAATGRTEYPAVLRPAATEASASAGNLGARPRYLSDDGRYVFFSTREALAGHDTNDLVDTYSYDTETGLVSLLSGGKGNSGAWFMEASASGRDVFFGTTQGLVAADRDGVADVYDARVGGGFLDPGPGGGLGCFGEACQPPSSQPANSPIGSAALAPRASHRHRKHRRKHHRRHRHRRHRQAPGKHQAKANQANTNRIVLGGSR